jgi:hypothetical protein
LLLGQQVRLFGNELPLRSCELTAITCVDQVTSPK